MIDVEPLPSDPTEDEWMEDSRRVMEENERENSHKSLNLKMILIAE